MELRAQIGAGGIALTNDCLGWWFSDYLDENSAKLKKSSADFKDTKDRLTQNDKLFLYIQNALLSAGFPALVAPWGAAQALFESNNARSNVAQQDHNFSGIKYRGRAGTTPGRLSTEGDHYAHYEGVTGWAKDFKRVVSQKDVKTANSNGGPAAIDATDLADYVHRLKVNGYFGASEQAYYNALKLILAARSNIPTLTKNIDEGTKVIDKFTDLSDNVSHPLNALLKVPTWLKVGGAVVGGLVLIKLLK